MSVCLGSAVRRRVMVMNSLAAASHGLCPAVFSQLPSSVPACVRAWRPRVLCKKSPSFLKLQPCWFQGTMKHCQIGIWALEVNLELRVRWHLMPSKETQAIKKEKKSHPCKVTTKGAMPHVGCRITFRHLCWSRQDFFFLP